MFQSVDLCCERVGSGPFDEPVNALTNLAFVLAAALAWRDARERGVESGSAFVLVVLLIAIALGSTAFHVFANRLSQWLDAIAIALFQLVFLWAYLRHVARWRTLPAVSATAALLAGMLLAALVPHALNGSLAYFPGFAALALLAVCHASAGRLGTRAIVIAAVLIAVALAWRTADPILCDRFASGTHFLWHVGAACTLYLVVKVYIANLPMNGTPARVAT